jgi:ribosome-binding factor A
LPFARACLAGALEPCSIMKRDDESAGYRHQRLQVTILEELRSLLRDDVTDPELEGVGVTAVALSPDYKNAKVHFVIRRGGARGTIERALVRATPFLRRRLADSIELKRTPDLRFIFEAEIGVDGTS